MGETKRVLEQAIEYWNAGDREAWATLYAEEVVYEAPGGQRIAGLADLEEKYFDALLTAAPDRMSRDVVLVADGECGGAGALRRYAHRSAADSGRS